MTTDQEFGQLLPVGNIFKYSQLKKKKKKMPVCKRNEFGLPAFPLIYSNPCNYTRL